ncbi:GGDEF domain-containing protein [Lacticaseibacillus daqingensis]|uniref:GGDEF domain-containing protein n=1 Tax=Lacticaseibacillus daqingensis TaxID=2486014 RepID=UPI000F79386C|nr:GGDEF domain-containing protein [Lacticaseibacillus daqingensis]
MNITAIGTLGDGEMVEWGLRATTFVMNSLVLIGYAMLFNWLQTTPFIEARHHHRRALYLVLITVAFLLLFHFASEFLIEEAHHRLGFGWRYINFQVATVLYALLSSRKRSVLVSLLVSLGVWFWWLPNTPTWPLYYLACMTLMLLAHRFGVWLGSRAWRYYPFCLLFVAPFFVMNWQSLHGIEVGWPWQFGTFLIICAELWAVHYGVRSQRRRQQRLTQAAQIDELTQLRNFRVFEADLQAHFATMQQRGIAYMVYTLDIDHFKAINDRYGHLTGNEVLRRVAHHLRTVVQSLGIRGVSTYRTGGEEFTFILPGTQLDLTAAARIAWTVHDALGQLALTAPNAKPFHLSVSLGVGRAHPDDSNYLAPYNQADQSLYLAKRNGRNTVVVSGAVQPRL